MVTSAEQTLSRSIREETLGLKDTENSNGIKFHKSPNKRQHSPQKIMAPGLPLHGHPFWSPVDLAIKEQL